MTNLRNLPELPKVNFQVKAPIYSNTKPAGIQAQNTNLNGANGGTVGTVGDGFTSAATKAASTVASVSSADETNTGKTKEERIKIAEKKVDNCN